MEFILAPALQKEVKKLITLLKFFYIDPERVVVFRSFGSKSRAIARIWGFPRIWQKALRIAPHYCLEVISEKFDNLSLTEKKKILVHEMLHIPKNFSGSLLPHRGRGRKIDSKTVDKIFSDLKS